MKEIIELQMYPELRTWIEEISYFFGKEVEENGGEDYDYEFLSDGLELLEDWYNVEHIHNDLIEALRWACECEIWDRCIYGKPVKIKNSDNKQPLSVVIFRKK